LAIKNYGAGKSLRESRLGKGINTRFAKINSSIDFDKRLYREDIKGSVAYARALKMLDIVKASEEESIIKGLRSIEKEIEKGIFQFRVEDEDIHMNIERALFEKIGDVAYKLHTGRSRNEQIVLDEKLYLLGVKNELDKRLNNLLKALYQKAKSTVEIAFPSYTHLRQAQLISLAHLFLAYYTALKRDEDRLNDFNKRLSVLPLGSAALAGSSVGIDRDFLMDELCFNEISKNSIDAVSTRDFIIEFEFICTSIFITLSRMSEDIIIYTSYEFGFFSLPDDLSTTSSLMPQKKNPDPLEIIKGKASRVIGNLMAILTLLKGLPYTYNRDLQEDKEGLFDTVDNTFDVIDVMAEVVKGLIINENKIKDNLDNSKDLLYATDIADYLVKKGMAFRKAHSITGGIVGYAVKRDVRLSSLKLAEYRKFSKLFERDIYDVFNPERSINNHDVIGGTAINRVKKELKRIEEEFNKRVN